MVVDDGSLEITCFIQDDQISIRALLQMIGNKKFIIIKMSAGNLAGNYYLFTEKDFELKLQLWKRFKPDISDSPLANLPDNFYSSHLLLVFHVDTFGGEEDKRIQQLVEGEYILVLKGDEVSSLHTGGHKTRGKPPERMEEASKPEEGEGIDKGALVGVLSTGSSSVPPPPHPLPQRYINSWLKDRTDNTVDPNVTSLVKEQVYSLYFDIDTVSRPESLLMNVALNYTHQPGEIIVPVTVRLETEDFEIYDEKEKKIYLPPSGPSRNNISFSLSPKHDGELIISVVFLKENNFIQLVTLKFNSMGEQLFTREELTRGLANVETLQARDINLTILDMGGDYQLIVSGSVSATARLRLKLPEIKAIALEARQALMGIVNYKINNRFIYQDSVSIPEKVNQSVLPLLAETGYRIYQKIFFSPSSGMQTQNVGKKLRQILQGSPCKIQIFSQDFVLPWGILYLADRFERDNIDPNLFMGLRHIIEHMPLQEEMLILNSEIDCQKGLKVSLNLNKDIDKVLGPLVSGQEKYWDNITIKVPSVQVVQRTSKDEVMKALKDPQMGDQILYFYCHGLTTDIDETGGVDSSTLVMTGNSRITMRDLDIDAPIIDKLNSAPLVFINACESAELSPLVYDGFVPYFISKGARGVIGSECKLPARFAVEWARRFFDRFLSGEAVGEVILSLRKEFFDKERNILGLLYALYVDSDTKLVPSVLSN